MRSQSGFTLVELAIVIVIIGLLVGGVLVGRDLIIQASVRAATASLSKYDVGVTAFRTKFGNLPGDMAPDTALKYGFAPRSGGLGRGDSNGRIESNGTDRRGLWGETALIWRDLSDANMIPNAFSTASDNSVVSALTLDDMQNYLPSLALATHLYIHAYNTNGRHFYLLAAIISAAAPSSTLTYGNIMTPIQAGGIDQKVDDGLGNSGIALAVDNITGNTVAVGAGAAGDCLNANGTYNRDDADANIVACRMAIRFNF